MWDPNKEGNYAWLAKQASKQGGVDKFIDDLHNEGYQEGYERGLFNGTVATTGFILFTYGSYKGIRYLIQKYKSKKKAIKDSSEISKIMLSQMCNESGIWHDESNSYFNDEQVSVIMSFVSQRTI